MVKRLRIAEITEILLTGNFDDLIDVVEDGQIEAKRSPISYHTMGKSRNSRRMYQLLAMAPAE